MQLRRKSWNMLRGEGNSCEKNWEIVQKIWNGHKLTYIVHRSKHIKS